MNFCNEMFRHQEIQAITNKIGEENNELFSSQFFLRRLYLADSWTL
jgi:hypothetical protein